MTRFSPVGIRMIRMPRRMYRFWFCVSTRFWWSIGLCKICSSKSAAPKFELQKGLTCTHRPIAPDSRRQMTFRHLTWNWNIVDWVLSGMRDRIWIYLTRWHRLLMAEFLPRVQRMMMFLFRELEVCTDASSLFQETPNPALLSVPCNYIWRFATFDACWPSRSYFSKVWSNLLAVYSKSQTRLYVGIAFGWGLYRTRSRTTYNG